MKLLLDANLSPRIVDRLRTAGFEAIHVDDLGLLTATDEEIFDRAVHDGLVVATADSGFNYYQPPRDSWDGRTTRITHSLDPDQQAAVKMFDLLIEHRGDVTRAASECIVDLLVEGLGESPRDRRKLRRNHTIRRLLVGTVACSPSPPVPTSPGTRPWRSSTSCRS